MKSFLLFIGFTFFIAQTASSQSCTPLGDQVSFGTNDTWIGYVYDSLAFGTYMGFVNEGTPGNPNFDQTFGGDAVSYPTNGCAIVTETFSVRYKLKKNFAAGNYLFTVGGDDGYRLSLDGGTTWVINNWIDQGYTTSSYTAILNGDYDMVLEYYENTGENRASFILQTICSGTENQSVYGGGNIWQGYIYDGINFDQYNGLVTEGTPGSPDFDETFGGDVVAYTTSACTLLTETFSARYRLEKNVGNANYTFFVGGDDGYRFSIDGGASWIIDQWTDKSYTVSSTTVPLNGSYNFVLEYYEKGGENRVSFAMVSSPLPVHLTKFNGKAAGKNNNLFWTASGETNFDFYEVERSSNGVNFIAQGKVHANEGTNNSTERTYSYTDHSPTSGSNYYRLKMVDKDGQFLYSSVIRILSEKINLISIFPTLYSGGNIYLKTTEALKDATVELYELTGKKLQEIKLPAHIDGGQTISIQVLIQTFAKGTYLLVCKSGGNLVSKQLIVNQ